MQYLIDINLLNFTLQKNMLRFDVCK